MTLRYTKQKIEAALQLLSEFKSSTFPHTDSTVAVDKFISILNITNTHFGSSSSAALTTQTEIEATALISQILELLGIISNSANVRNSFEIHGPVLDVAKRLLADESAKLIISFEWNYIPYTYPQNHPHLPSFVIIGLPASEASNALVLPAIGHELGHSLWRRDRCKDHFEASINQTITDSIRGSFRGEYDRHFSSRGVTADHCDDYRNLWTWAEAADYCFRQVEEVFSDFTGLSLFGASYLDSFEYLLGPSLSTERSPEYPSVQSRAQYLQDRAATPLGVSISRNLTGLFAAQNSPFHRGSEPDFQMRLADAASNSLVASIAEHVASLFAKRKIQPPDDQETTAVLGNFLHGVPGEHTTGLGPILNAGWATFKDDRFMVGFSDPERMRTINELVLKSVEVFEIERMTGHGVKKKRPKSRN